MSGKSSKKLRKFQKICKHEDKSMIKIMSSIWTGSDLNKYRNAKCMNCQLPLILLVAKLKQNIVDNIAENLQKEVTSENPEHKPTYTAKDTGKDPSNNENQKEETGDIANTGKEQGDIANTVKEQDDIANTVKEQDDIANQSKEMESTCYAISAKPKRKRAKQSA